MNKIRKLLVKYHVRHFEGTAKWADIVSFYQQDSLRKFRLAPRLQNKHIDIPPFAKLKVKLSPQVLSHSVAAGIEMYVEANLLGLEAAGTADFCARMDQHVQFKQTFWSKQTFAL